MISLLDNKGLSEIKPNLNKRTIKTGKYQSIDQIWSTPQESNNTFMQIAGNMPNKTPIEASRTRFGEDFIQYIKSRY